MNRSFSIRRIALGVAALVVGSAAALGAASAAAQSAEIRIASDDGVNIRPAANTAQAPIGFMPDGASPDYICFRWGEVVGDVPIWFEVTYNGVTGYYASKFDDSRYTSDANLTTRYGVPKCTDADAAPSTLAPAQASATAPTGSAEDSDAPPSHTTSDAPAQSPRGKSLYYSPYNYRDHGMIVIGHRASDQVHAPSPADVTIHESDWASGDSCPDADHVAPPGGDFGDVTTLASWSAPRWLPLVALQQHPELLRQIHYIIMFDPGTSGEIGSTNCDPAVLSQTLASWLAAGADHRLVVMAGDPTVNSGGARFEGRRNAGIQQYMFPAVKTAGAAVRERVTVCNYDDLTHEQVWLRFRDYMNMPPITNSTCPAAGDQMPSITGWSP